jgi:hypothetical protein
MKARQASFEEPWCLMLVTSHDAVHHSKLSIVIDRTAMKIAYQLKRMQQRMKVLGSKVVAS